MWTVDTSSLGNRRGTGRRLSGPGAALGAAVAVAPAAGWATPQEAFWLELTRAAGGMSLGLVILAFLAMVLVCKAGRVAMAALLEAWRPAMALQAREVVSSRPGMALVIGVANGAPGAFVLLALLGMSSKAPFLFLLFLLGLATLMGLTCLGLAGVYGTLGRRLRGGADGPLEPGDLWRGGAAFETATALPVLGHGVALIVLTMALGAGVLALFASRNKTEKMAEDA